LHRLHEGQGGFKNPRNRSRRRQSALISGTQEKCADCRRRLRFLACALDEGAARENFLAGGGPIALQIEHGKQNHRQG